MSKYGNVRTFSALCGREFSSRKEAARGEELALLQKAGEITGLEYQPKFVLSVKPRITYAADFKFMEDGVEIVEDSKGFMTRECRVKLAWLKASQGVEVKLT